ncbi:MAG TPA: response regulator transcription factor [Terriglobales bacterium]|nr:response regulator transcription factor [Terriglobales bacterium]
MPSNPTPLCRILIVDDQEAFRRILSTLVVSHVGWTVCGQASDGLQAVQQAKLLVPDVIIMDVFMPNMNGIDATRIIRAQVSGTRILMISQDDPSIVQRQTLVANAHGFLAKADLPRDLLPAIERILSVNGQSEIEKAS